MAQDLVISVPEVQRRQNEGEIVFLDARNPQAWAESEENCQVQSVCPQMR